MPDPDVHPGQARGGLLSRWWQEAHAAPPWRLVLRDAAVLVGASAALACLVNALRPDGIAFFQTEAYEILVPCPETQGEAPAVAPGAAPLADAHALLIDARPAPDYARWHLPRAINVSYDYLAPTAPQDLRRIVASGAREVLVYGDGDDPDSGEQLARELVGKGIRNVRFVLGGAPALQGAGQGTPAGAPPPSVPAAEPRPEVRP